MTDHPEEDFALRTRPRSQLCEQAANELSVMPFLGLDHANPLTLRVTRAQTLPMTAIRVGETIRASYALKIA